MSGKKRVKGNFRFRQQMRAVLCTPFGTIILRGEPGLERRKLHDIRYSFLGCLTYEMFQVLLK